MNDSMYTPFVSVIIPVFNEEKFIGSCIASVLAQDWPRDKIEIIVVDNGSTDKTIEIANNLFEENGLGRVIQKIGGTIAAVRNHGWRHSRGEVLAFLDGDSVVDKKWLQEGCGILKSSNDVVCVGFAMAPPAKDDHWIKKVWYQVGNSSRHIGKGSCSVDWLCSFNIITKLVPFANVGGFDEKLKTGEDHDIGLKLGKIGKIIFSDSLYVKHLDAVDSITHFIMKEYWRGKSIITVMGNDIKELLSVFIPMVYFIVLLLTIVSLFFKNSILLFFCSLFLFILPAIIAISKVGIKMTNYLNIIIFYFFYLSSRGAAGFKL